MDDDDYNTYQRRRETFLTVFLAGFTLIASLYVVTLLTGGFLIYILLVVAACAAVGVFHYLLWGRSLSEEVAGEREEMEGREQGEEEWGLYDPRRPRHF